MIPLLFVSGEYPPAVGGVGDYTDRLRTALSAEGWTSRVLTRGLVQRWDLRSLVWLLRVTPSSGVVHIQFQAGAFDLLGDVCLMPLVLRRCRPGVRVVTTFHDTRVPYLFPRAGATLRRVAVRLLARTSDAVIAADERDLEELGSRSTQRHLVPIGSNIACSPPSGYTREEFRRQLGLQVNALVVVYFGLLNASKGLDLLVDAFRVVAGKRPDARLMLVGGLVGASDPTDRRTADRVLGSLGSLGSLGEGLVVRSTGWLPAADVSAHLLAADVALLPYVDGASPRRGSLLACAEHGLPIVSTLPASGIVADAVRAVPATPEMLASAVLDVAENPSLANRLRQSSHSLAAQVSWPRIAATHIQIYNRLIPPP